MEFSAPNQPDMHNPQLKLTENFNKKDTQNQQYQKDIDQLLNSKKSSNLSDINKVARKRDLTKISLLNQENLIYNSTVYQKYLKNYHKNNHLYFITENSRRDIATLAIYDTDSEKERILEIEGYKGVIDNRICITPLPKGYLFCFGGGWYFKIATTAFVDQDYSVHSIPSYEMYCSYSSAIYYNNSVYCFGGSRVDMHSGYFNFSMRFDLHQNIWIYLSPLPEAAINCTTVIFNGNILISNPRNINIWQYSIDLDSFSIIPYNFNPLMKIMINTGERLYLIECNEHWLIYESDFGDEFSWNIVSRWRKPSTDHGQACYAYNNGNIYIGSVKNQYSPNEKRHYYKFNLDKKMIRENNQIDCRIF